MLDTAALRTALAETTSLDALEARLAGLVPTERPTLGLPTLLVTFAEPVPADALCRAMGWDDPYAFSYTVHQTQWAVFLRTGEGVDPHGRTYLLGAEPQAGVWRVRVDLVGRPSGPLPDLCVGPSPAYSLDTYPALAVGLSIRAPDGAWE